MNLFTRTQACGLCCRDYGYGHGHERGQGHGRERGHGRVGPGHDQSFSIDWKQVVYDLGVLAHFAPWSIFFMYNFLYQTFLIFTIYILFAQIIETFWSKDVTDYGY